MSRPNPSAPSSRLTKRSYQRMGWIRIMTKSTCAFCSNLAMEGQRGNPCMSDLRRSSRSLDTRLSSFRTKRVHKKQREILLQSSILGMGKRNPEAPVDPRDGRGGLRLLLCTMQRMRAHEQSGHELLCHDWRTPNSLCWKRDRPRGLLRESQRRQKHRLRSRDQPLPRQVGVG